MLQAISVIRGNKDINQAAVKCLCVCKLMFRTDALSKQTDNNIQTNNERNGITYVQSFTSMNQVVEGLLSGF